MKKIVATILALSMLLTLSITAFAADTVDSFGIPDTFWGKNITGEAGFSGTFPDGVNPLTGLTEPYVAVHKITGATYTPAKGNTPASLTVTFSDSEWLTYDHDGDGSDTDVAADPGAGTKAKTKPVPVPASLVNTYEDYLMYAAGDVGTGTGSGYHAGTSTTEGGTTIGVMSLKDTQVSFTVPLYVTLAVVGDGVNGTVYTPSSGAYKITNTSNNSTIAVTGLKTEKAAGSTWTLKNAQVALTDGKDMLLKLNGNTLLVDDAVTTDTDEGTIEYMALAAGDGNYFVKDADKGQYTPILKAGTIGLELVGKVKSEWAKDENAKDTQAAAQWTITYTISQCDSEGYPIKAFTYVGNNKNYVFKNGQFTTQGAFNK